MDKVGILTFHAAYNYGSVLQAFATQEAIRKLGYRPEVINYRFAEQKHVYAALRFRYGVKELVRDLSLLPIYLSRKKKYAAFESFFQDYLQLTKQVETPEQVSKQWEKYDAVVSGSDQIWNKHALELENADWKFMMPYLLQGYAGKKISYASSIANMHSDELEKIKPQLLQFNHIAMRESSSAATIAALLQKEVVSVLDPTFLLNQEEWTRALSLEKKENDYILFYSLGGIRRFGAVKPILAEVSKREKCKILVLTPFCYVAKSASLVPHPEYGPVEFLCAVKNARKVITDSYHGTILSINFCKDVYSLCKKGGSEFRKTDILKLLGMQARIVTEPTQLLSETYATINYTKVQKKIDVYREKSISYLDIALKD